MGDAAMRFRPCIDLHQGRVKQIVGSSLDDGNPDRLQTNFVADRPASWFAALYRADRLTGGISSSSVRATTRRRCPH